MLTFRATPVTDATAHALLAEYFAYREATFPNAAGYVTAFPTPAQFVSPEGVFLVAELDGESVGCGGIRSLGGGRFEVKHLWLRPTVQGRGFGRALLAELERRAVLLGATELVLDTNASLEAAGRLYASSDYVEIEPYNENPNATNWYGKRVLSTRTQLAEAIASWRMNIPQSRELLADSATAALMAGIESQAVAEMAGMPANENPFAVDALVDHVIDQLDLSDELSEDSGVIAARPMCRLALSGGLSLRELTTWAYAQVPYDAESRLLLELVELDDDYDLAEVGEEKLEDVENRIREVASALLARDCV